MAAVLIPSKGFERLAPVKPVKPPPIARERPDVTPLGPPDIGPGQFPGETFRDLGGALGYGLGRAGEAVGGALGTVGESVGKYLAAPTRQTYALTPEETARAYQTGELPPGAVWTDSGPAYPAPRLQPRGEELGQIAQHPLAQTIGVTVPAPVRGPGVILGSRGIIKLSPAKMRSDVSSELLRRVEAGEPIVEQLGRTAGQIGERIGKLSDDAVRRIYDLLFPRAAKAAKPVTETGLLPEQLGLAGERVPTFRPEGFRPEVQAEFPGGVPSVTMREGAAAQAQRQAALARGQAEFPLEVAPPAAVVKAPITAELKASPELRKFLTEIDSDIAKARQRASLLRRARGDDTEAMSEVRNLQEVRQATINLELPKDLAAQYESALSRLDELQAQKEMLASISSEPAYPYRRLSELASRFPEADETAPAFRAAVKKRFGQSLDEIAAAVYPEETRGEELVLRDAQNITAALREARTIDSQIARARRFVKSVETGKILGIETSKKIVKAAEKVVQEEPAITTLAGARRVGVQAKVAKAMDARLAEMQAAQAQARVAGKVPEVLKPAAEAAARPLVTEAKPPAGLTQAEVDQWLTTRTPPEITRAAKVPPVEGPPVKAMESPPPPATGQPLRQILMRFRSTEDIIAEATQPTALRRVTEALGQTPFRGVIEVMNPAAVVREPSEKMLLAYQIDLDAAAQAVNSMGVRLQRLKNPFTVTEGRVTNVQGSPAWGDVFQTPKRYPLSADQQGFVGAYRALVDDAAAMLKEHNVPFRELGFGPEEGYFPRLVNAIREVERSRGVVRGAIGAKQTFQKGRVYSEMAEGLEKGIKYEDNPLQVLELHLRGVYKTIADKRLTDALKPLGRVPRAPLALREEAAKVGLQLRDAKRLLNAVQRSYRGERLPTATLGTMRKAYPEQVSKLVPESPGLQEVESFAKAEITRLQPLRRMAVGERTKALERARQPSFSESYIMQPGVAGRIFPIEVANAVSKAVGQAAPEWLKAVSNVNILSRTLGTTLDVGAPFLQGLPIMASHPVAWSRATLNHLATVVKPEVYANYLERYGDVVNEMASYNVPLGMGGAELVEMAGRIPGFRRFGRAFTAFGDIARLELWKALRESAAAKGELHQLAAFVRNATGTTPTRALGVGATQRLVEANLLFAPRFTRAAFALMLDAMQGGIRGSQARRSLVSLLTASAAMTVGGGMALGLSKEEILKRLDPRGGLFMTLPIFGQNIGPGGNVISVIRLLGEIAEAAADDPSRFADLDPRSQRNPVTRWLRGKSAPLPSAALDLTFGQDFLGDPTNILQVVGRRALPFWAAQVVPGLARAREATAAGVGAQFLGLRGWPESLTRMLRDNLSQERFKKQWQDLNFQQQALIRKLSPNLVEAERQSKAEGTPIDLNRMAEEQKRTGEWVEGKLPSNLRSELKDLGMTFGGLSRGIGSDPGWYMNDTFYDRYKTLAAQRLTENMKAAVSASQWKTADDTIKRAIMERVITLSRGQARLLIMRESRQEERVVPTAPSITPRAAPSPAAIPMLPAPTPTVQGVKPPPIRRQPMLQAPVQP